jgi:hypothetical protein
MESYFKELKQDMGSQKSQCRTAQSVTNHLNFCMMATTITWIYVDRIFYAVRVVLIFLALENHTIHYCSVNAIAYKVGKKIFGCEQIFDHAAKANQSDYPWAQNIVSVGLLKRVHARWACLFLDFRLEQCIIQGFEASFTNKLLF